MKNYADSHPTKAEFNVFVYYSFKILLVLNSYLLVDFLKKFGLFLGRHLRYK